MHLSLHSSSFFPPSLSLSLTHTLTLSWDALGSVECQIMDDTSLQVTLVSGQPTSAPLMALFPNGSGPVLPVVPLSRELLCTIIGRSQRIQRNPEPSLPTLDCVSRLIYFDQYRCLLVISFPALILHLIYCPLKLNTSNFIFTQHFYSF